MGAEFGKQFEHVTVAESDEDIAACCACMKELRPDIEPETFVARVRSMEKAGYRLAFVRDAERVVAVAGFRLMHTLFAGDNLYVDDLVTLPAVRSQGYGKKLIDWLRNHAVERQCSVLHLDSGTQRDRAHRFYFANGFHINCYHFAQRVSGTVN